MDHECRIKRNEPLKSGYWRIVFEAPEIAAAARGEKLIGELREAIPAQRRYKDHEDGVWDCGTMDAWRWRIAQEIMNINTELQKKGVRK